MAVPDRDLLFGLLALQNGLIDQVQLVAAFQAWTRDKARPLAGHLVARSDLDAGDRDAVEALIDRHVRKHGDVERSLAAVPAGKSTRDRLAAIADEDLNRTLSHAGSGSAPTDGDADRTATYAVGESLADGLRFRVLRPHAQGGLGAVFVALDDELHREVALKQILEAHADDPKSRQRFLLEAEITGGLEHPGIVPVYGLGAYKDGRPYYAMRFIRGDSLKEAIDRFHRDASLKTDPGRRSLELRKLLRRFTDVCNAIEYAHSRGVLHRDIKPGNVIVGKHGETLVVDWGLARARGRNDAASDVGEATLMPVSASGSAETLPGQALGTPAYMSPEQARGDLDALGPRSDVYSLGATLSCLLTGKGPFEGDVGEILRKVQAGERTPPRRIDPSIDPALEAVCLKAMSLEPSGRYASCRSLAEDIERWAAGEPVAAYPEPWTRTLARWLTRHRTGVTAAVAAGLVAMAGLGSVAVVQTRARADLHAKNIELSVSNARLVAANRREADARAMAVANARQARLAETRAESHMDLALVAIDGFRDAVDSNLEVKDRPENADLRRKMLLAPLAFYERLRDDLRSDPEADPEARVRLAETMRRLALLNREVGSAPAALDQFRAAADLYAEASGVPEAAAGLRTRARDGRIGSLLDLGAERESQGDVAGARADFDAALGEAEAEIAARPDDAGPRRARARALYGKGQLDFRRGEMAGAHARAGEALAECERVLALAPDDPQALELACLCRYGLEARALVELSRYDEALAGLAGAEEMLARGRAAGIDPEAIERIEVGLINRLASVYQEIGRNREALASRERAVAIHRARLRGRPTAFSPRLALASALLDLGSARDGAGELGPAAGAIAEAGAVLGALRADFPRSPKVVSELGRAASLTAIIAYRQGNLAEAVTAFREVSALTQAAVDTYGGTPTPKQSSDIAGIEYNIGILLDMLGKPDESIAAYDRAVSIRRRLAADFPDQPTYRLDLAHALTNMANARHKVGREAALVLRDYREAVAMLEALAASHPNSAPVAESLGRNVSNFCDVLERELRFTEAEARSRAVAPLLEARFKAEPDHLQVRIDLAFNRVARASALAALGRADEARRHHREAIALLEPIVAAGGDRNEAVDVLSLNELCLARLLAGPAEAEEAAALAGRAADRLGALRASGRLDETTTGRLRRALATLARRLAMLGRADDAYAAWDRAEAIPEAGTDAGPDPDPPLELLAWSGDSDGFLAQASAADEAGGPAGRRLLDLAAAASLAAGRSGDPSQAAALADRAVSWLCRARDLGLFPDSLPRARLFSPDFAPVSGRPDFRQLVRDVSFPDDPFAQ